MILGVVLLVPPTVSLARPQTVRITRSSSDYTFVETMRMSENEEEEEKNVREGAVKLEP
jgi:UPF0716 family protein affecting phage T7 exclusion